MKSIIMDRFDRNYAVTDSGNITSDFVVINVSQIF